MRSLSMRGCRCLRGRCCSAAACHWLSGKDLVGCVLLALQSMHKEMHRTYSAAASLHHSSRRQVLHMLRMQTARKQSHLGSNPKIPCAWCCAWSHVPETSHAGPYCLSTCHTAAWRNSHLLGHVCFDIVQHFWIIVLGILLVAVCYPDY